MPDLARPVRTLACLAGLFASPAALAPRALAADPAQAHRQPEVAVTMVAPGVALRELIGRGTSAPDSRSSMVSIARFDLTPGHGSAWSHNKVGEEAFLVLAGHGTVWIGEQPRRVGPGDYVLVQPSTVRSVRADRGEALSFYAITSPAWSQSDDVLVAAPAGVPR